jgi:hypothetical protein
VAHCFEICGKVALTCVVITMSVPFGLARRRASKSGFCLGKPIKLRELRELRELRDALALSLDERSNI